MNIDKIIDLIDKCWKFDNNQIHTHSWHDKQDLLDILRKQSHQQAVSGSLPLLKKLRKSIVSGDKNEAEPVLSDLKKQVDEIIKLVGNEC